jgi:hypothetical protein
MEAICEGGVREPVGGIQKGYFEYSDGLPSWDTGFLDMYHKSVVMC